MSQIRSDLISQGRDPWQETYIEALIFSFDFFPFFFRQIAEYTYLTSDHSISLSFSLIFLLVPIASQAQSIPRNSYEPRSNSLIEKLLTSFFRIQLCYKKPLSLWQCYDKSLFNLDLTTWFYNLDLTTLSYNLTLRLTTQSYNLILRCDLRTLITIHNLRLQSYSQLDYWLGKVTTVPTDPFLYSNHFMHAWRHCQVLLQNNPWHSQKTHLQEYCWFATWLEHSQNNICNASHTFSTRCCNLFLQTTT